LHSSEGAYNNADQAVDRDESSIGNAVHRGEQDVEDAPENMVHSAERNVEDGVQDVEDVPSDIGGDLRSAAGSIGDKIGGVKNEGDRVERGVQGEYDGAEQSVDQFDQGVQGSYDQGEQQGQQQGW
jgi:hypothetical protein